MRQNTEYQYRKVHTFDGGTSYGIVIPKQYAARLLLKKGGFVKVRQDDERIVIERA
jgi:antitoxin component of MazEF toxin-antitoxin module